MRWRPSPAIRTAMGFSLSAPGAPSALDRAQRIRQFPDLKQVITEHTAWP